MASKIDPLNIPADTNLELFISPTCPYCRAAMQHYDSTGTKYTVHDVENNADARKRMFGYSGGDPTVPVIVANDTYVQSGWGNPPRG